MAGARFLSFTSLLLQRACPLPVPPPTPPTHHPARTHMHAITRPPLACPPPPGGTPWCSACWTTVSLTACHPSLSLPRACPTWPPGARGWQRVGVGGKWAAGQSRAGCLHPPIASQLPANSNTRGCSRQQQHLWLHPCLPFLLLQMRTPCCRAFVHALHAAFPHLPVLGVVDWNPSGVAILSV